MTGFLFFTSVGTSFGVELLNYSLNVKAPEHCELFKLHMCVTVLGFAFSKPCSCEINK